MGLPKNIKALTVNVRRDCINVMKMCGYSIQHEYNEPPLIMIQSQEEFKGDYSAYHDNEMNVIVFKEGEFTIDLLAHELTHTLQPDDLFDDDECLDYCDKRSEIQAFVVAALLDVKYRSVCGELVFNSLITNLTKKIVKNLERNCKQQTSKMISQNI